MAARSSAAGDEVDLRVFPEALHRFTSHPTGMATVALDGIEAWIANRLEASARTPGAWRDQLGRGGRTPGARGVGVHGAGSSEDGRHDLP